MRPKAPPHRDRQQDLFCLELHQIINLRHPLVSLSHTVNWDRLDELFGATFFCQDQGRLAISTRVMVGGDQRMYRCVKTIHKSEVVSLTRITFKVPCRSMAWL